jgi:glycosyltransferase involved in cell wall biosynthesis
VQVLGHGVNVDGTGDGARFRAEHGIDGPLILYLGRKANYKGYPLLLQAAPQVWAHVPEAHFAFVGPGAHDPNNGLNRIRADDRVHDLDPVSNQGREDAYAACDIFCLPSQAEAFGLSYLEAWYYGKPVVGLTLPTLQELIGSVRGGLLTKPSPASVADALVRLLNTPTLRDRLGARGRKRAQQQTWEDVALRMRNTYQLLFESSSTVDAQSSAL